MARLPSSSSELLYFNSSPEAVRSGVLAFPFYGGYFPRLDHAAYRERPVSLQHMKKPHAHPVYHIVVGTGGKGTYFVDGQYFSARKGLLLLVAPGVVHTFNNDHRENKEYCVVTFEWVNEKNERLILPFEEMLTRWTGRPCRTPLHCHLPEAFCAELTLEIRHLVQEGLRDAEEAEFALLSGLWRLLCSLGRYFRISGAEANYDSPLVLARQYLQNHYREKVSIPELAGLVALTPNYLSAAFRRKFGLSPIKYLNQLRASAACSLLASSEYPLKAISSLVGFEDIYYFTKVFKKVIGVPPFAYRRRMQQAQEKTISVNFGK